MTVVWSRPPNSCADLRQRQVGELAAQVHRDLPGVDQRAAAGGPAQVLHRQAEVLGGRRHDRRPGDLRAAVGGDQVLEHELGQRTGRPAAGSAWRRPSPGSARPRARGCCVAILLAMNSSTSGGACSRSCAAFLRRIAMRVSRSGGWTSVIRPHSKRVRSRSSSVVELLGRPVGGDDDLLAGVVQRVEGVEELLLRALLVLQELDVVDQQDVDVAVAPLERLRLVVAQAVDEVVGELLGAHVAHPRPGEQVRARSGRWRAAGASCRARTRRR